MPAPMRRAPWRSRFRTCLWWTSRAKDSWSRARRAAGPRPATSSCTSMRIWIEFHGEDTNLGRRLLPSAAMNRSCSVTFMCTPGGATASSPCARSSISTARPARSTIGITDHILMKKDLLARAGQRALKEYVMLVVPGADAILRETRRQGALSIASGAAQQRRRRHHALPQQTSLRVTAR